MRYTVIGMGRSGHRYIVAWMAKNLPGKTTIQRDCIDGWENGDMIPEGTDRGKGEIIEFENDGVGDYTIKTIEEMNLNKLPLLENTRYYKKSIKVVVRRSPVNWLSSSIKGGGYFAKNMMCAMDDAKKFHWVVYPEGRLCAYKSYFGELPKGVIIVDYDSFVIDNGYKDMVRNVLRLGDYTDHIKNDVNLKRGSLYGYSSFGKNVDMYLNRYDLLDLKQKKRVDKLMDKDMIRIQKKYYGKKVW